MVFLYPLNRTLRFGYRLCGDVGWLGYTGYVVAGLMENKTNLASSGLAELGHKLSQAGSWILQAVWGG